MKTLLALCAALALASPAAGSAQTQPRPSDRDRLAGAWNLIQLERPGPDGKLERVDSSGLFVFTADGHLSVQVMDKNPRPETSGSPQQYAQGGYEASYGTYTIDETNHTFTFHVDGALVPSLIGKDLPRRYDFRNNLLIVQSTQPDEHWRVVWQRF